ncbi:MAG: ATP synthase subunit I [Pseudomonadota bacterium]|jgi:ATP synthase protein I
MQSAASATKSGPPGFVAIVGLQAALVVACALVVGVLFGTREGWSTLAGGAACWVPSALFAWRFSLALRYRPEQAAAVFFVGEFAKVLLTLLLLAALARTISTIWWPGAVLGVIVAVKSNWLALLMKGRARQPGPPES